MTKYYYLKKERSFPLYPFLLLAILSAVSCQKQPVLNFGSGFVTDQSTAHIALVDTSTVTLSTVYTDSTSTAGTGFLLIGNYNDPYLGVISSRAFLQLSPPPQLPGITSSDTYDSIGLIMIFKKGNPFYGDTSVNQTFTINQVDTLYKLPSFRRGLFSNSSFPLDPASLGTASATIAPSIPFSSQLAGDTIKIKMPDALGRSLYNMIFNGSDTVKKLQNWLDYFHGLCISPGPGSQGAIFGFNDSATMRIYYHEASVYTTQKFIDFSLTTPNSQFNNIIFSPKAGPATISQLATPSNTYTYGQVPPITPDSLTGNVSYVDGILGLNAKLTFPNLAVIAHRRDYISVLRATLIVRPAPGSYTTTWRLPPVLNIFESDQNNQPSILLPSSTSFGTQTGNLKVDFFNPSNTFYAYDVTNFIKTQIVNSSITASQDGLMLAIPPPATITQFERAVLADFKYPVLQRVTLQVFYISLYPHQ
jgi:hypothetical protein